MNTSAELWFPAGRFFNEGDLPFAIILLLLQATLIFWPLAVSMARRHVGRAGVERLLAELAETHRPKQGLGETLKSFRKVA